MFTDRNRHAEVEASLAAQSQILHVTKRPLGIRLIILACRLATVILVILIFFREVMLLGGILYAVSVSNIISNSVSCKTYCLVHYRVRSVGYRCLFNTIFMKGSLKLWL